MSGGEPKIKYFQIYGPVKSSELEERFQISERYNQIFKLQLFDGCDHDIFLIDCEGTNNIFGVSRHLKPAIIAISQVLSVMILIYPGHIEQKEIDESKNFFGKVEKLKIHY